MSAAAYLPEIVVLLLGGTVVAFVAFAFGIVPIVGFLLAGIVIGPGGLGLVRDPDLVNAAAEIGVILLLFTIGIQFSLAQLARIQRVISGGGGLQVGLAVAVTAGIGVGATSSATPTTPVPGTTSSATLPETPPLSSTPTPEAHSMDSTWPYPHRRPLDTESTVTLAPTPQRAATCDHTDQIRPVHPSSPGFEECVAAGDEWVHLRICMTCGHVGCCDSSKSRHASRHHQEVGHPIARSMEPGESWGWCFVDGVFL